jgi:hypothetical protein
MEMFMKAYIGIDVSCAKKKRCPISICVKENGRLIPLLLAQKENQPPLGFGNAATLIEENNIAYAAKIKNYILDVCKEHNLTPVRIAIDAPLIPKQNHLKRRIAELTLDSRKISCYATPSQSEFESIIHKGKAHLNEGGEVNRLPHSMQIFMLAGFAIYQSLREVAECIEVFPHATAKILGTTSKHKTKENQAYVQLHAMSKYTGWPSTENEWNTVKNICSGDLHDKVDAYGAAWVASLDDAHRLVLGDPSINDAINLPRLELLNTFDIAHLKIGNIANTEKQTGEPVYEPQSEPVVKGVLTGIESGDQSKTCPACGLHNFKRWPWGWDAHAAHKCTGLVSKSPETRKHEFKAKFL